MALPASPPITLSAICAEFGAPPNTPLASFLRGGAWVPNTPTNAGVPAALPITMLDLLGAAATVSPVVNLDYHFLSAVRGVGAASAAYRFLGTGGIEEIINGTNSGPFVGEWLLSGVPSGYEVRVSGVVDSALTGIANNVWQNASTTWTATLSAGPIPEAFSEYLTVEIRPSGGGSVLTSNTVEMYAERF